MDTYENIKEYYKVGNYCYNQGFHHILNLKRIISMWPWLTRSFCLFFQEGFPRSRVDDFYKAIQFDPYSDLFFDGSKPSFLYNTWAKLMLR